MDNQNQQSVALGKTKQQYNMTSTDPKAIYTQNNTNKNSKMNSPKNKSSNGKAICTSNTNQQAKSLAFYVNNDDKINETLEENYTES